MASNISSSSPIPPTSSASSSSVASAGLEVYTSPRRPLGRISDYDRTQRYSHEILSYTILRLHLANTRLYRWLDGKSDD